MMTGGARLAEIFFRYAAGAPACSRRWEVSGGTALQVVIWPEEAAWAESAGGYQAAVAHSVRHSWVQ